MPSPAAVSASPSARDVAYCREARRLRGRLPHRPVRLYRRLRQLSDHHDTTAPPAPRAASSAAPNATPDSSPCPTFAAQVRARLDGPVLRLAQRRALLKSAARLGIARFHANLIIAAVQHESAKLPAPAPAHPAASSTPAVRLGPIVLAVTVQSLIALAAWWVASR